MLARVFLAPIRFYRRYLSGLKRAPTCRFLPTCSEYALEAIETRGAVVGGAKAVWRILRCNPLFRGGYDPVVKPLHACTCVDPSAAPRAVSRAGGSR